MSSMKRVSITFYDEIMNKLEARMQAKGMQSIAQCVRELVDLGLKIEAAAKEKPDDKPKESEEVLLLKEIKNLMKNNLTWSMESRLLARILVENMPAMDKKK